MGPTQHVGPNFETRWRTTETIRRLGPYVAGGVAFVVETNVDDVASGAEDWLRDLRSDEESTTPVVLEVRRQGPSWLSHPWGLWRNGEPCETTVTDEYVQPYLLWEITRLVFEAPTERLHLHGAAVELDGRAIVLAGRSHAGKSTLAGWLTHQGWGFLTDEVAIVNPDGPLVEPFPRPIGVRHGGPLAEITPDAVYRHGEALVPASSLGRLGGPTPLEAIVFPTYQPGSSGDLQPVSPAKALAELATYYPGLPHAGREGFRRLATLVEATPTHHLAFDDLDTAERLLRDLLVVGP
jgi:hypothetical protein